MRRGFVYLAAVMDWASRRILAWRVSISLTTDFCLEAVEEALAKYGTPKIFNTDQGSQPGLHRSAPGERYCHQHGWKGLLARQRVRRAVLEVDQVRGAYLHAYDSVSEGRTGIGRYIEFYNTRRPHRSRDGVTPESVYFNSLPIPKAA